MSLITLERAVDHIFMAGVDDSGAKLCEANVPFGLAKIQWVQKQLGIDPDATFVGSPDCTITRNEPRWKQGFGYGGVYQWSGDFAVLDLKTNSCGMLAGSLDGLPELEAVREKLHLLDTQPLTLDGVEVDNDLTESNHFVDVFTVDQEGSSESLPGGKQHAFIMHSSGHELRGPTDWGPGLYWDQSKELLALATVYQTPWGALHILEGQRAVEWYAFYKKVQDFTHRRREALASHLFGHFDTVVNATHQGLVRGVNQANIGCYHYEDPTEVQGPLFPLTLSPTLPAFMVRGHKNLSNRAITDLGWDQRLDDLGMRERIQSTNVLPHGGGYLYPQFKGVAKVVEVGPDDRRFELVPSNEGDDATVIETPRNLAYGYRGMEVKERLERLELGEVTIKLDLNYILSA